MTTPSHEQIQARAAGAPRGRGGAYRRQLLDHMKAVLLAEVASRAADQRARQKSSFDETVAPLRGKMAAAGDDR